MSLFTTEDVAAFQADRLIIAASAYWPSVTLSQSYLLQQLRAAEADIARQLKVRLKPTTFFSFEPTQEEIDAVAPGYDYDEEPGYDYSAEFFQADSWGYIVTRARPIIAVDYIRFAYPDQRGVFYSIPDGWIRLDKKIGHIRLVPTQVLGTLPLTVFIMQAMGGGRGVPGMIQVKYDAGLRNVKTDPKWADLLDVIYKSATLKVIKGAFLPQSGSLSADGLSQSLSVDASKYGEDIQESLFGPKGSNGGLFSSIHGLGGTALGASA